MAQKGGGFSAGLGLHSAANFSPGRPGGGMSSGGSGGHGPEQMGRPHSSAEHLSSTSMKLFSSLGLSPSDLDALAQIPEDQISVETLPHILRQLKNRKSHEGYAEWDEPRAREGPRDLQYTFRQDSAQSHDFGRNFGPSGDFSQLSRHDFGMSPSSDSTGYMQGQGRVSQPSQGKVEDFLGLNPPRFPHVCLLCDFDIHSIMEWNQHVNGLRHAENGRVLLNMYPDWEPPMSSSRSGGMDTPNLSDGILGPAPLSGQTSGLSSGWGGAAGLAQRNTQGQNTRARVVVVKYDRRPLSDKSLFSFVEPFGRLREHLLLKNKGFLEMSTHDEALDIINYYQQNPATLGGRPLVFELSKRLFIEKPQSPQQPPKPMERIVNRKLRDDTPTVSQVVYFSNLPRGEDKKNDLLTIAGRFGTVEKHLFLQKEGFIQLSSPREAEMMEKYYSMNPLVVRGHQVRCHVCTKYKTLNVPQQGSTKGSGSQGSRGARSARSSSPRRSTDRKRSPSPKPRTKTERRKEERPKPKAESKPKPKPELKPELKPEIKAEPKAEPKPEPKPESESEPKSEPKAVAVTEESGCEDERPSIQQEPEGEGEHKVSNGDGRSEDTPEEEGGVDEKVKGVESEETKDTIIADTEECVEGNLQEDEDFLENMDDMVVVDEIEEEDGADAIDNSEKGGMRVVLVVGFKKGYNHLNELMQLAQPFGKVVRYLILDMQNKAYLQFSTEEEAVAMAKFYNGNVQATVCGRPVKIWHYTAQPTIQFGFVVYIGKLPDAKYTKDEVLELVEQFGKVRKYFLHYIRRECYIEMDTEEQAERVVEHYRQHPAVLYGQRLTIYVSRKYRVLRGRHVVIPGSEKKASKREKDSTPKRTSNDEPPVKRIREERTEKKEERTEKKGERKEEAVKEVGDGDASMKDVIEELKEDTSKERGDEESKEEASKEEGTMESTQDVRDEEQSEEKEDEDQKEENSIEDKEEDDDTLLQTSEDETLDQDQIKEEEEMETNLDSPQTETSPSECDALPLYSEAPPADSKPTVASLPLPPYDPNTPLGVEHVKMGYYCRICFLIYSNEETAKRTHCSSQAHYDKLQKYLEKRKTSPK
ncbi:hypothetical protein NQD34_003433 [Periophthalmus magnuspinnatus]|nr:hypothetical protein NQD34_003433 [Periophthalmus magnuspinnatus]